ncbi:hypothetical protein RH08_04955 [Candidatus Liberibacter asiaticus]|nr:hypothetical protein B2I23_05000 [Candidatus Liberibacter asiaticus]AWL14442.1 hypothetical protein DIC79_05040 [Candidatus Liberibacter asiaticus]KIH96200.1 hypothetical protein RH08_04955 [Candidatus Liberibacter asiaticus]KRF68755.1 hypothetical protein AQ620_03350 [Candidatus Liberibacter asiaticus]OMH86608.1 hypothetical protein BWK56_05080 [Candidatus Liberibacter asiaticus]
MFLNLFLCSVNKKELKIILILLPIILIAICESVSLNRIFFSESKGKGSYVKMVYDDASYG